MTSLITARVNNEKREVAEKVFNEVGLTTSAAINLYICAVAATGGIPFAIGNVSGASTITDHRAGAQETPVAAPSDDVQRTRRAAAFRRFVASLPNSGRKTPYRFSRADGEFRDMRCA